MPDAGINALYFLTNFRTLCGKSITLAAITSQVKTQRHRKVKALLIDTEPGYGSLLPSRFISDIRIYRVTGHPRSFRGKSRLQIGVIFSIRWEEEDKIHLYLPLSWIEDAKLCVSLEECKVPYLISAGRIRKQL